MKLMSLLLLGMELIAADGVVLIHLWFDCNTASAIAPPRLHKHPTYYNICDKQHDLRPPTMGLINWDYWSSFNDSTIVQPDQ
jgi:hypothetical protein